ncbi:acyl-CoA dehydrogenase family protein [Actinophytocola gossypii]|uniref:Acyl-CoA dehydrogenase family protein n=1 Tax=Actinophytocola gossypii TaxID=2812003 RepID=A0ABT2JK12_9PSEU|nr:acyl-CoA dehydrogenase family protein [Actinophytocola gossypii]MCT2587604.1 acyl-CoA dehydrogenase family protein [Actinophytocola gossypii]
MERVEEVARTLPPVAEAGEPGRVNAALLTALADTGLLGEIFRPEGDGYAPTSATALCVIREGLARHCTEAETAFALQGLGAYPILLAGRPDTVARWIPRIAAGEVAVGFALTEPGAGSDAASLALRAEPDGDGFRLTGEKAFISNAPDAAVYSVFARTSDTGSRGITAFAVPGDADGLTGTRQAMVSPHPIGRLRFDGVRVPAAAVLGEVDDGWRVAMRTLDMFRPSVGAFAVGMAQAALDAAVAHTADREAFGRPLRTFQAVSHQLAEVATRVHAARLLVRDAAAAYDAGTGRTGHLSAMAKLFATETAQQAVDVAIQVHGARALERGHLLEHLYREVRAPRIYEGASEVQREIIARQLYR